MARHIPVTRPMAAVSLAIQPVYNRGLWHGLEGDMQKSEVEADLATRLGISKNAARDLLNVILDEITLAMSRGQRVALPGFGIFEVRAHGPRKGRNPQTGEALELPAGHSVIFKPGKALKYQIA